MIKPTYNNVFVCEKKQENTTASGIVLSGSVETGAKPGVIKALGPDIRCNLNIDDVIYLKWGEGLPITVDGVQGVLINEEHIKGIL